MVVVKADATDPENLLQDRPPFSFGVKPQKRRRNKNRIRRIAEPHLELRKGKYYVYRRGEDAPIYIGDADTILKEHLFYKEHNK